MKAIDLGANMKIRMIATFRPTKYTTNLRNHFNIPVDLFKGIRSMAVFLKPIRLSSARHRCQAESLR